MKNILLALTIILIGCSEPKSEIETKIEGWIQTYAHNPDSHEPISTDIDTVSYLEEADIIKKNIKFLRSLNGGGMSDHIESLQAEVDSILNLQNPSQVAYYMITHKCRLEVPVGGLMINTLSIKVDTDYNLISLNEKK